MSEALSVLGFAQIVEFPAYRIGELARDLGDVVALAHLGMRGDEAGLRDQNVQIGVDDLVGVRSLNLHDDRIHADSRHGRFPVGPGDRIAFGRRRSGVVIGVVLGLAGHHRRVHLPE